MTSAGKALQALALSGAGPKAGGVRGLGRAVAVLGLGGRGQALGQLGGRDHPAHRPLEDDRGHGVLQVDHDPLVALQVALVQGLGAGAVPPGVVQPQAVDGDDGARPSRRVVTSQ